MKLITTLILSCFSLALFAQSFPGQDIIGKGYNVFGEFANNKSIQPYPLFDFSRMSKSQSQGYTVPRRVFLKEVNEHIVETIEGCLLYTSPSPRDLSTSRMPSSA